MQKDSSKAIGVYKHVKSLFNSEDIKRSFKYFAPIAAVSGFISDVITPIAPVIDYLAI